MKPHSKNLQYNFVGQRRQYDKSFVPGRLLGKHFCRLIINLKNFLLGVITCTITLPFEICPLKFKM